jgi:hypothetical protein
MDLVEWFKSLWSKDAEHMIAEEIPYSRTDRKAASGDVAKADQTYFRVKMAEMFLQRRNHVFATWYPAVHGLVQCRFADQTADIPGIADAMKLGIDGGGTGDVIAKNFTLCPLLPFKGGEVRIIAGLYAMKGVDMLQSFLGTLSEFSTLLAVPQVSGALAIARPLAAGLQKLIGGQDGAMHLAYANTFVGAGVTAGSFNGLRDGYFALVRATRQELDPGTLWVKDDQLRVGGIDGPELKGYDFMLLHVELRSDRDDFRQIRSIADPLDKALTALLSGDEAEASTQMKVAWAAVVTCPDLTAVDRRRVFQAIKDEYDEAKKLSPPTAPSRGAAPASPARGVTAVSEHAPAKKSLAQVMTIDEAIRKGPPTLAEALAD